MTFSSFQPIEAADHQFWEQFWAENVSSVQDVFALIPAAEIRALREESPSNLATLCYKVGGGEGGSSDHFSLQTWISNE